MKTTVCLFVLLAILGCAHKREVRSYRMHGNACEQLGYDAGSDDWAGCTTRLERARNARLKDLDMETSKGETMSCDLSKRPTVCK